MFFGYSLCLSVRLRLLESALRVVVDGKTVVVGESMDVVTERTKIELVGRVSGKA